MEKLIELLYEYNKIAENKLGLITSVKELGQEIWFDKKKEVMKYECEIISKSYGFIKWLVDNDKIDKEKFNYCRDNFFDERYFGYGTHEYIIMMLAIQDEPIEFLLSILK